uniref:RING-type domain-containing protein n=2 Tax=Cuerna arida TaxID=1464854 RepID=A0A1B6GIC8_9HEMI
MSNLEEIFMELLETSRCPVCFERCSSPVTCCINGHAICDKCRLTQKHCPVCRCNFSCEKHTILNKILEILPYQCKYEGCSQIVRNIKDHEKWCGYRPTSCRLCKWTGQVNYLTKHIIALHCFASADANRTIPEFRVDTSFSSTLPHFLFGQVFWKIIQYDHVKQKFNMKFVCVPNEDAEKKEEFHIRVEFNSEEISYHASSKVYYNPEYDETSKKNQILFDGNIFEHFVNNGLEYNLIVISNVGDSIK